MLGDDEGMKSQLQDIIYGTLCVKKSDGGERIMLHFSRLTSAPAETTALLPIEVQGLYRIHSAIKRKHRPGGETDIQSKK